MTEDKDDNASLAAGHPLASPTKSEAAPHAEPHFHGVKIALQRLKPLCPDCGRECAFPNFKRADGRSCKPLNELSDCDRTRQHEITCVCGVTFMARFYEHQSPHGLVDCGMKGHS